MDYDEDAPVVDVCMEMKGLQGKTFLSEDEGYYRIQYN